MNGSTEANLPIKYIRTYGGNKAFHNFGELSPAQPPGLPNAFMSTDKVNSQRLLPHLGPEP